MLSWATAAAKGLSLSLPPPATRGVPGRAERTCCCCPPPPLPPAAPLLLLLLMGVPRRAIDSGAGCPPPVTPCVLSSPKDDDVPGGPLAIISAVLPDRRVKGNPPPLAEEEPDAEEELLLLPMPSAGRLLMTLDCSSRPSADCPGARSPDVVLDSRIVEYDDMPDTAPRGVVVDDWTAPALLPLPLNSARTPL